MSRRSVLPMDSYRLADYVAPLSCYLCGEGNTHSAEACRHCGAPMALAQHTKSQKLPQHQIAVLAAAGGGKTTYLGMLVDMLSRQNKPMQMLARGAFSIGIQESTIGALRQCRFPDPTPSDPQQWNWLLCQVSSDRRKRPLELIIPDLAGAAVSNEIQSPGKMPVVKAFLSKCAAAIVLIDAAEVEEGRHVQDFFAMKVINYLCAQNDHRRHGWPNRPVALVYTKSDRCPDCFADPLNFTHKHVPSLWELCHQRLRRHRFFAASVAGACSDQPEMGGLVEVPLRIEPRGIVEPFEWMIDNLKT